MTYLSEYVETEIDHHKSAHSQREFDKYDYPYADMCTHLHAPTATGHGHINVINVGHHKSLSKHFPFLTVAEAACQQGPAAV